MVKHIESLDPDVDDFFGGAVSLSGDGSTLAVGAAFESGRGAGVGTGAGRDPDPLNNSASRAGAVYLY